MEGKTVFLSVLIMSLVMAQIQVEARICCRSPAALIIYNRCIRSGRPQSVCLSISGCRICSSENSGDDVNEYCNLGCASSVCGALTTLENSDNQDASEIVKEADEKCIKACSTLCATGSKTALDQIA